MELYTDNPLLIREGELVDFSENDPFCEYCSTLTSFCPFLEPAYQQKVLYQDVYQLPAAPLHRLEAEIFYLGVVHTENFRHQRRGLLHPQQALLCHNLILVPSSNGERHDGKMLLAWPHYLLKVLYTKVNIMFGKFWEGEREVSRNGQDIPPPPLHFLSIRSGVKSRDPYFFKEKTPQLLDELISGEDDGHDVHEQIGFQGCTSSIEDMRAVDYYSIVRAWIEKNRTIKSISVK